MPIRIQMGYLIHSLISIGVILVGIYFLLIHKRTCPSCRKPIRPFWRGCSCALEPWSAITQEPEVESDVKSTAGANLSFYDDAELLSEEGIGTEVMLPPVPLAWLILEDQEIPEKRYEIRRPGISIGSSDDNDIVLNDRAVSRHHAKIRIEGKKYFIYDLASMNGTRVNGRKIAKKWIKEGDCIEVGHSKMAFRISETSKYKLSDLLRI